jgi:hypothetical protein
VRRFALFRAFLRYHKVVGAHPSRGPEPVYPILHEAADKTGVSRLMNDPIRMAASRNSQAVRYAALPTVFFMIVLAFQLVHDATFRSSISIGLIDRLLNGWLYYSFFSLTSILLYKIQDDYRHKLTEKKWMLVLYLATFLIFANNFLAALLRQLTISMDSSMESTYRTDNLTMSLSYLQ